MLNVQRRLAAQLLKCGENRVRFDPDSHDEIKEAITKADIRGLINSGTITKKPVNSTSRFWARHKRSQKSKGKQKGPGSRKGKKTARHNPKQDWMNRVRLQRKFLKTLRAGKKISTKDYHELYMKIKGGFFRSIRHLKIYTQEKSLLKK